MKKVYYSWGQVQGACLDLAKQINDSFWTPDYIVGLTRGGLVPAVLLSQYLNIPMETLKVSLRDSSECESNLWMPEDAVGYVSPYEQKNNDLPFSKDCRKNILIVDDINDTGNTIAWIKNDWQQSCFPDSDEWDNVWGENVRVAVLTNNLDSSQNIDYSVWEVNKAEEDVWLVYPWEEFWLGDADVH